jgi:hypothetical protein
MTPAPIGRVERDALECLLPSSWTKTAETRSRAGGKLISMNAGIMSQFAPGGCHTAGSHGRTAHSGAATSVHSATSAMALTPTASTPLIQRMPHPA